MTPRTLESIREMLLKYTFHEELVTADRVNKALEMATRNLETNKLRTEATHSSIESRNRNVSLDGKHISEYVHQLKMPVLLVWGRNDYGVVRLENGISLLRRIDGAEMHILDHAKHLPMVDQAERFASIVTDFLKD